MNSGGASFNAPPLEKNKQGLGKVSSPPCPPKLSSSCRTRKATRKTIDFSFLFPLFHFCFLPSFWFVSSLPVADPAVGSRMGVGLPLWAPLEEGGLLLAGEEAGRRRLAPVEAVIAEEAARGVVGAVEAAVKICLRRGSWLGVCCERLEEQRRKEWLGAAG